MIWGKRIPIIIQGSSGRSETVAGAEIQKKSFWSSGRAGVEKLFASDQDVINGTLKGQIHTLMPRYNFFTNYRYFSYRELVHLGKTYKA